MRLIDVDKIVFYTPKWCDDEGLFVKWLKEIFKNAPTVDAVPVAFIKSEIKHTQGVYPTSLRILLDAWEERKGE